MFTYLISIVISIIIMNFMNFDQFTILLGVVVGSFFYIVFLIEEFFEIYETEMYVTFQVKEDKRDEGDKE
jgi:low affinity Fe/Cu permease